MQQVRAIKDWHGSVLTGVMGRWEDYFEERMNEEYERERRGDCCGPGQSKD